MKGQMGQLMRQAQKMQEDMQKAQEEIGKAEITGESGGGMVKVVMNGRHEVRRVTIDPSLAEDDLEMTEDLVAAAINDAVNKVAEMTNEKLGSMSGGLGGMLGNLPGGMKLPF